MRKRLNLREQIEHNQAQLRGLAKLAGKPEPVFSEIMKPKRAAPVKSNEPAHGEILKSVLLYLKICRDVAWAAKFNSGTFAEGDRFIAANTAKGCSDILGQMADGRFLAVEVKTKSDTVKSHQQAFIDRINAFNGVAFVARSVDEVMIFIDNAKK